VAVHRSGGKGKFEGNSGSTDLALRVVELERRLEAAEASVCRSSALTAATCT
jgi:hypothetical protein